MATQIKSVDSIIQQVCDAVNSAGIVDTLHETVDPDKRWDGKVAPSDFIVTSGPAYSRTTRDVVNHTAVFLLSFGSIKINIFTNVENTTGEAEVNNICIQYILPRLSNYWQPLYRNRLERSIGYQTLDKIINNPTKLSKAVLSKVNSLEDGIADWFKGQTLITNTLVPQNNKVLRESVVNLGEARLSLRTAMLYAEPDALPYYTKANELVTEAMNFLLEMQADPNVKIGNTYLSTED